MEKYIVFVLYLDFFFFFCKYPRDLKEYKGNTLHSYNRLFMCLNSKFDELNEFYLLRKPPDFVQCLEFFLKCKIYLREIKAEFMQKRCLVLLQYTFVWITFEF